MSGSDDTESLVGTLRGTVVALVRRDGPEDALVAPVAVPGDGAQRRARHRVLPHPQRPCGGAGGTGRDLIDGRSVQRRTGNPNRYDCRYDEHDHRDDERNDMSGRRFGDFYGRMAVVGQDGGGHGTSPWLRPRHPNGSRPSRR